MQKERRQFSIEIGKCDGFVKLSSQAQALYFQLCLSADDEGFTSQIEICMFMAHANEENLEELIKRRFVYVFDNEDSRVAVIKHWWTNNYIREDKIVQSTFAERSKVFIKDTGVYTLDSNNGTALPQRKDKQGSAKVRSTGSQGSDPRCPSRDGAAHRPLHTGDNPIQSNTIQSNPIQSNTNTNSNQEIDLVRTSKKQNALLQILIESGFIDEDELQDPQWEERLDQFVKERKQVLGDKEGYVDAKMKVQFVISSISHTYFDGPDRNGKPIFRKEIDKEVLNTIANKFLWFDAALDKAVRQMEAELPNYCPEDDDGEGQDPADEDPFK